VILNGYIGLTHWLVLKTGLLNGFKEQKCPTIDANIRRT